MRKIQRKTILTILICALFAPALVLPKLKVTGNLVAEATSGVSGCVMNWSFEQRNYTLPGNGVYGCPPWETNNGGWRDLRGDVNKDGTVDIFDSIIVSGAYGSHPGDPNWKPDADINGDAVVDMYDANLVSGDFNKTAKRVDGAYSWYTSGGGDYLMWQTLDYGLAKALASETVKFSFRFYPETIAPDGSKNKARAQIKYLLTNYDQSTVYGQWVSPTSLGWWEASVITQLPFNIIAVGVVIQGQPDFKAWVDKAQLNTYLYNLYYTTAPYSNMGSDPQNNTCRTWTYSQICAVGNDAKGWAEVKASDTSGVGIPKIAHIQFNRDPPTGNSPTAYVTNGFSIGVYWYLYGYLGSGVSSLKIEIDLYYLVLGQGWELAGQPTLSYSSIDFPNQQIAYYGSVMVYYGSPPRGAGTYSVAVKVYASAAGGGGVGSALADAWSGGYGEIVYLLKISD